MSFLALLEQLRTPWLDEFFLGVTMLGEQAAAIAVLIVLLWCVDKRRGWRMVLTLLTSTGVSQFLKAGFRIERPFVRDPDLHPVEAAVPAATGYSFPSGHTQTAGVLYGALGLEAKRPWLKVLGWALLALVGFSRLYLGVHTPEDVLVGGALSLVVLAALQVLFRRVPEERQSLLFWGGAAAVALLLAAGCLWMDTGLPLVEHGMENLRRFLGMLLGLAAAYELDSRLVRFQTAGSLPIQLLKLLLGAATAGALYLGLNALGLFHGWWGILGNALIVFYAGGIYPISFKWWTKKQTV